MSWISPFSLPGQWFKGNLHTHTTQSDGELTPEQAAAWYRERGYDFISVTDHWVLTRGQAFGASNDFITLTGAELHGPTYHMLALGLSALPGRDLEPSPQAMADAVCAAGGLPFFAHPRWTGQTSEEIAPVRGILGIEVFNAVCQNMEGLGYSNMHWDELLARGLRLWGLAVDDTHWRYAEQGLGFVMVRAERLDEASLLDAIRQGRFYASTGPVIHDLRIVELKGGQRALRVRCSPCQSITYFSAGPHPRGKRFVAPNGNGLDHADYPLRPDQIYLRVECQDAQGRCAWSNPVYTDDLFT